MNLPSKKSLIKLEKPGFHAIGNSLYFRVNASGGKSFVHRMSRGKQTWVSLGSFPELSLDAAHQLNEQIGMAFETGIPVQKVRNLLRKDNTPDGFSVMIYALTGSKFRGDVPTFRQMHGVWFILKKREWQNSKHVQQNWNSIKTYCYPFYGDKPVDQITPFDIAESLEAIWVSKRSTADRVLARLKDIFGMATSPKYAYLTDNPAEFDRKWLLPPRPRKASRQTRVVAWDEAPAFWREFGKNRLLSETDLAVQIMILSGVSLGNIVAMQWEHIDFNDKIWTFQVLKRGGKNLVKIPLTKTMLKILKKQFPRTGDKKYVFAHDSNKAGHLTGEAVLQRLRKYGASDVTAQGFRQTMRQWLDHLGYKIDLSGSQIAANKYDLEESYQNTKVTQSRRIVLQHWEDFLSGKADTNEAVRLKL